MKIVMPAFKYSFSIPYWAIAVTLIAAASAVYWFMRA